MDVLVDQLDRLRTEPVPEQAAGAGADVERQRLGRPGAANLDAALVLACGLMALALLVFVCLEQREDPHA